eukprot:9462966-Pyramimonas_sp.AAC.1
MQQWRCPHAVARPSAAFRGGLIGSSTEGPSGGVRMRLPHPVQRFVASYRAPPKALVAVSAC